MGMIVDAAYMLRHSKGKVPTAVPPEIRTVEVIKEVPGPVQRVEVPVEIIKEVPVEVIREVIREVQVPVPVGDPELKKELEAAKNEIGRLKLEQDEAYESVKKLVEDLL